MSKDRQESKKMSKVLISLAYCGLWMAFTVLLGVILKATWILINYGWRLL